MHITKLVGVIFLLCCIPQIATLKAQVTIGSEFTPKSGVLLDLKEEDDTNDGGANARRGLLLPRVQVEILDDLMPLADKSSIDSNDYLGAILYNSNKGLRLEGDDQAIYLWEKKKWERLGEKKITNNVQETTDQNGNSFYYRNFGNAGTWMLQNLRATSYDFRRNDDNDVIIKQPIEGIDPLYFETPVNPNYNTRSYAYPRRVDGESSVDKSYLDLYPIVGLFYSLTTAFNVDIVERSVSYEGVQGICPYGWYIPTRDEWMALVDELVSHPDDFAEDYSANGTVTATNYLRLMEAAHPSKAGETTGSYIGHSLAPNKGGMHMLFLGISQFHAMGELTQRDFATVFLNSSKGGLSRQEGVSIEQMNSFSFPSLVQVDGDPASLELVNIRCKKLDD